MLGILVVLCLLLVGWFWIVMLDLSKPNIRAYQAAGLKTAYIAIDVGDSNDLSAWFD